MTDTWERLPAVKASGPACLCCGTPTDMFPMDGIIAVGFGSAFVSKDGLSVYEEPQGEDREYWTGADAEMAAVADPDHDWRIVKIGPLYEAEYQRHGDGQWVMVRRGDGFA